MPKLETSAPYLETIVLVPGLWIPAWAMSALQRRLLAYGFAVYIFSYHSRREFRHNAERLQLYLQHLTARDRRSLHLVGYSLGGLLVRALFHFHPQQAPGRIVTLGTPHTGSHAARVLSRWRLWRYLLGDGIAALLADAPQAWTPPASTVGTIAGSLPFGAGRMVGGLPKPNDGTVAVSEAQLAGAADTITLKVSHVGMLLSRQVARQIACFLRAGQFCR